jgi:hypothetical protein
LCVIVLNQNEKNLGKKYLKKNKKNFTPCTRAWHVGDLVKIKPSTWEGRPDARIGLLLREVSGESDGLFPHALIYDMHKHRVGRFYLYDLELISAIT